MPGNWPGLADIDDISRILGAFRSFLARSGA